MVFHMTCFHMHLHMYVCVRATCIKFTRPKRMFEDTDVFQVPDDLVITEREEDIDVHGSEKESFADQLKHFAQLFAFVEVLVIIAYGKTALAFLDALWISLALSLFLLLFL
jgi:hypothetical protein